MGLLDKIFGRKNKEIKEQSITQVKPSENTFEKKDNEKELHKKGKVSALKILVDKIALDAMKERYIAFDVETTGLSPYADRIIELGAVLFEKGVHVKKYGTLVNAKVSIPASATAINNISNEMIKNAPSEEVVYSSLIDFLGDALQEKTVICAHNAKFDLDFLSQTLMRLGYDANIYYVDTLSLSRNLIKGLENYKQDTVAAQFDIYNDNAHRAESDAEICGKILWKLLELKEIEEEKNRIAMEKSKPSEDEMEVCAVIQNIILNNNGNTDLLGFYKNSSGYIDVNYLYNILKFKFSKKGKYIIVEKKLKGLENFTKEPCTVSEGGADYIRLFFNSPLDLELIDEYIYKLYKDTNKSAWGYLEHHEKYLYEYKNSPIMYNALSNIDVENIITNIKNKDYGSNNFPTNVRNTIERSNVEIFPLNNRVPLSEIQNLNNWDKGYDKGYPYWEKGEELRKAGDLNEALTLYDKARFNGYCAPVLFESYAMVYHKLKDYDNEIDILDEGIIREGKQGTNISRMITKRDNAIRMLLKQREKEQSKKEKVKNQKVESDEAQSTQKRVGRAIYQMDDDLNIIEKFETVSDAVRSTGINSKSIRDAAKGVQKHAGGYVWKYADEFNNN